MTELVETDPRFAAMRAATPARIGLPRAGAATATACNLGFALAHAEARDAVHAAFDPAALAAALEARGLETISLHSAAADRRDFLLRPDLGRRLDEASAQRLEAAPKDFDLAFVIADGLSARATHAHATALIEATRALLRNWRIAPVAVVEEGRVAIGDAIGAILRATLVAVVIGERPGLSSPDSLGVYLTYDPRPGRTDAERNCLSNIRPQGMPYAEAARRLAYLCEEARRRRLTGTGLKDESHDAMLAPGRDVLDPERA